MHSIKLLKYFFVEIICISPYDNAKNTSLDLGFFFFLLFFQKLNPKMTWRNKIPKCHSCYASGIATVSKKYCMGDLHIKHVLHVQYYIITCPVLVSSVQERHGASPDRAMMMIRGTGALQLWRKCEGTNSV